MGIFADYSSPEISPQTVMTARHTHIFSAEAMQEKESLTEQPYSILRFMPAFVCCRRQLHNCRFMCTNTTIAEKSECHSTRFTFCSTINQILK